MHGIFLDIAIVVVYLLRDSGICRDISTKCQIEYLGKAYLGIGIGGVLLVLALRWRSKHNSGSYEHRTDDTVFKNDFERQHHTKSKAKPDFSEKEVSDGQAHHETLPCYILPAKTSHTRIFPKKHSFAYSYLYISVPVGMRSRFGTFLSIDPPEYDKSASKTWFSVCAADHLQRGYSSIGLYGKLDSFLRTHDRSIEQYAHTYLVTSPRFMGYSFNPVSFWYLYDGDMILQSMILEVNNTFGERRAYLLDQDQTLRDQNGFSQVWSKDFHVSPFNSRKGHYSLEAADPFSESRSDSRPINNVITLRSSKGHVKLVARVFSTTSGLDPSSMNHITQLKFVASWWWVGLVTFPRILKEAGKLFFRRKLHVWYRPEVMPSSIGQEATQEEAIIAGAFESFLDQAVQASDGTCELQLTSASLPLPGSNRIFRSRRSKSDKLFELNVLSAAFYRRLAATTDLIQLLHTELSEEDVHRALVKSNDATGLVQMLSRYMQAEGKREPPDCNMTRYQKLMWIRLRLLRGLTTWTWSSATNAASLDRHVMQSTHPDRALEYREAVSSILLSNSFAFGSVRLLFGLGLLLRLWICWTIAANLSRSCKRYAASTFEYDEIPALMLQLAALCLFHILGMTV